MKLALIIVSYNSTKDIKKLITSIYHQKVQPNLVVIVDNDSSLDNKNELEKISNNAWYTFISAAKNWWFAYGCNIWVKRAFELGATHIGLINPDAILSDISYIEKIKSAFQNNRYLIFWTYVCNIESKEIEFWWAKLWKLTFYPIVLHRWEKYSEKDIINETDYATGSSLFFTKELYKNVGDLDESYFMYFEETDYCMRARKKWYSIGILGSTYIDHNTSSSVGRMSWFYVKYMICNFLKFAYNHAKWYQVPGFILLYIFFWVPGFLFKYLLKKCS